MTFSTAHITFKRAPSPAAPDPYTCYIAPYGAIGVASDLLALYTLDCLTMGRTPLYPKRAIRSGVTRIICAVWVIMIFFLNLAMVSQCGRPGSAPQLVWIAIARCIQLPILCTVASNLAMKHLPPIASAKGGGAAGNGEVGDASIGAEEACVEAGGAETTTAGISRYRDASVQAGDGMPRFELEDLPSYSVIDPHAMSPEEVRKVGIGSWYAAPEIEASSRSPMYIDKNQESGHPANSQDQSTYAPAEVATGMPKPSACSAQSSLEISQSHAAQALPTPESLLEEAPNAAATQPLLPGSAKTENEPGIVAKTVGILVVVGFLMWIPACHISLAVQSVASGNNSALVVGLVFLAVFLAGISTLLIAFIFAWRKAARTEMDVWKAYKKPEVEHWRAVAMIFSILLLMLYPHINLGAVSGRWAGVVPSTANADEYFEYWAYLVVSRLPLLCF